jgi:hypothetical protein
MRRLVGRIWRVFPLRSGALLLMGAAMFVVWVWGPQQADFFVYPASLVALGLVLMCSLLVSLGAFSLWRSVNKLEPGIPASVETGLPMGTGFRCPSLRRWLVLDVSVSWPFPEGATVTLQAQGSTLAEVVTASRRGRFDTLTRRFSVQDVFGLARVSFDRTWDIALCINPAAAHGGASLAAGRAQGETFANPAGKLEGDLVEMRQYAHGDSIRHVLWKVYARSRKLLVRVPERALAPGPVSVAFFVSGPQDEASAGAARLFVESGLLGADPCFAADGASSPARTPREALDQLVDSQSRREHGGECLETVGSHIEASRLSSCLIFAPPVDGPWRAKVADFVRKHQAGATVILGIDGLFESDNAPSRLHAFLFQEDDVVHQAQPLTHLRAALEADGLTVKVLHRPTGHMW